MKLHRMSVEGRWDAMAAEVSDDAVRIFAACGTYRPTCRARSSTASAAWRIRSICISRRTRRPELQRELLTDIRRIPHTFAGFDTNWQE